MAHVRDRPSLRESVEITTPSGNRYRWGDDEDSAANVPSGERFTDTMPGGFAEHEAVLPRKPSVDYSDLERLSTLTRYDASGGVIWQGRLERAPKVSGDQMAISPSAVGWQAHLEDDKSVREIFRDIDISRWTGVPLTRKIALNANFQVTDGSVTQGTTATSMRTGFTGPWGTTPARPISEAWYDARGIPIGILYVAWQRNPNVNGADPNWTWVAALLADDGGAVGDSTGNLRAAGPSSSSVTATNTNRTFAMVELAFADVASASQAEFAIDWTTLAIYGGHNLNSAGIDPDGGFYDGQIIGYALDRWCPLLRYTNESVTSAPFPIQHSAFIEQTTVGEIVRQTNRFSLRDWAVWDDLTFWLHDRGARGRTWRARVGPSGLEETGPQVERLWESVIVAYQDVDGTTRTIGPPGSGADTESTDLKDNDPDNPANKLGITRRDMLTMGVTTVAGATEIGRRFLEESKLLDSSGRAQLIGHVQDSHGTWHPYSHVRAGDTISFVDSSDTSYRRIVRTDKSRDERSCSVDLDAPPEGLAALLERLGVVLVPLGV